jgi:RNA binding exosome subunit
MAKTMFGNSTIVLGSETDDKLFEALKTVLASYHAEVKESSYNVVGSQEITVWEAKINSNKLKVCSETYEGLSIKGSTKLINEIKIKVERQVAI